MRPASFRPGNFALDGFLVLRRCCPAGRVEAMRSRVARDLDRVRPPVEYEADVAYPGAPPSRGAPGGSTVRRLLDALARDRLFVEWACAPEVLDPVRSLLGSEDVRVVRAHHNCIMTKQPEFSSLTGWHQDIRYWAFERPELVNAWTALDFEGPDNGAMRVIPGSHRAVFDADCFDDQRFFREEGRINRDWIGRAVEIELSPGDVLLFHAGLLHAAGRNTTCQPKRAVVFSYRAADNPPLPGTRSSARPDLDPARRDLV
ncbi:MAG: phytanoyl-CoA dioxygenase family protein [Wenzhouxiangellaceae bacterium]